MNQPTSDSLLIAALASATLALIPTANTHARAFTSEVTAGTTLRCSTAPSVSLSEEVLSRYSVKADEDAGLLSCVIQEQGDDGTLRNRRGAVTATARTLTGIPEALDIREILDESTIGYIASYQLPANGPLSFEVQVAPEGNSQRIRVEFDDLRPRQ